MDKNVIYPLGALRAVVLGVQGLTARSGEERAASARGMVDVVKGLGYVQIDTLSVVNRAHYLTMWSRLGAYGLGDFDGLIYKDKARKLYEGWGHAASVIALEHYRYHRWRADHKVSYNPTFQAWWGKPGNRKLAEETLARIRAEGGLGARDFTHDGPERGAWYDWKPPKMALEALFARGELMVADRVNFHRVYDVTERVLPGWVDRTPVPDREARRFCLEQAARALGVFDLRHLTLYAYLRATPVRAEVKELVDDGTLVMVRGESMKGARQWLVHRDNLPLLKKAANGGIVPGRTTFLSPFDSLLWAWGRAEMLWGFAHTLECYKPAAQRVYGYFCLPILHKDRLVGRFDPKLDRKSGVLHVPALYLEPGVKADEELVADVAVAMRGFLAWHGARGLKVAKSDPAGFGRRLMRAVNF